MRGMFTSIKQRVCFHLHALQGGFLRWVKPPTTSLVLGTLADLTRSKSELVAENALLRILRNSADAKGGIIEDYSLFHPVWLVEERKVVHDAYETPVVPTTGASQERLWLWKAEIFCQSVLFPLKTGAKEEKTAETLIVPHF